MNLDYIIAPVSKELIKKELTKERFVRITNKASNEIYIVNHHNSPNVMLEFRVLAGRGGMGKFIL